MKIDRRRFIEIRSDKKVDRQIITINENGVIEISREMQDVLKKNVFSLHISEDSRQLLLDPAGSGTVIRNDESITAKYLILKSRKEGVAFFPAFRESPIIRAFRYSIRSSLRISPESSTDGHKAPRAASVRRACPVPLCARPPERRSGPHS